MIALDLRSARRHVDDLASLFAFLRGKEQSSRELYANTQKAATLGFRLGDDFFAICCHGQRQTLNDPAPA